MAKPNFKKPTNARGYYVLGDDDWDTIKLDDLYEDFKADMPHYLAKSFPETTGDCLPVKDYDTWDDWNYPETLLATARVCPDDFLMPYTGTVINIDVLINIYWVAGDCAGATLDWDLGFRYEETKLLSNYDGKRGFIEDVVDAIFQNLECFESDTDTPAKRKSLTKWLSKTFDSYADKVDEFCKSHCTHNLNCVGVFSNGEAVYAKA